MLFRSIMMLGSLMAEEGYETLDLTPGGGAYKEKLANSHDEVHVLELFFSRCRQRRHFAARCARGLVRRAFEVARIRPEAAKSVARRLCRLHRAPVALARKLRGRLWHETELRVYSFPAGAARQLSGTGPAARDRIADLIRFEPCERWQSRQVFLSTALSRLEEGTHVYTVADAAGLLHYGWLIDSQSQSYSPEVHQQVTLPAGSACVFDFYTVPRARGKGLYQASLLQMLHDAASTEGVKRIVVGVLADNAASRHVIEKAGFEYEFSMFERFRLGRRLIWSSPSCGPSGAEAACPFA